VKIENQKSNQKAQNQEKQENPPKTQKIFSGLSFLSNHLLSIWCSLNT